MKDGIDYGKIPGTPKPTLYKPGSEKLLSMFHLAAQPVVEDLSTPDCMRFRVYVKVSEMGSGRYLGEGVGEASSAETKYQWRGVVCQEEFDETPEDRRRALWKKGQSAPYRIQQVRTCMEDVANTILKMAKKRAQIDAVLTVTAASDVFMQDAPEIVDAGLDIGEEHDRSPQPQQQARPAYAPKQTAPAAAQPEQQTSAPAGYDFRFDKQQQQPQQQRAAAPAGGPVITEPQARRFYAIARGSGKDNGIVDEFLNQIIGVSRKEDIPKSRYDEAIAWAEAR